MTRIYSKRRALLALSIGASVSAISIPARAQDAAVTPPPVVATQPAPAAVAPPPVVRTVPDIIAPEAQASIQNETPKKAVAAAKVKTVQSSTKSLAKAAPAPVVQPTEPVATSVATADDIVAPAAEPDIAPASNAPVVEAAAPAASRSAVPDQDANSFGASENDWLYWVGGLAGLLGLAGAGAALSSRRSRSHRNEHFADEGHVIVESHEAPSFTARSAYAAVPRADAQFAPPASSGYAAGYKSDSGVWTPGYFESMVDDGPSEVNPFLTRKNRLRRARFLDRQAANNEPIFDWRGQREIQFASQVRTGQVGTGQVTTAAEPELVH